MIPEPHDLQQALSRLRSLHDGDLGVIEVVAFGRAAIPHLRKVLFEREPSGLFETRCRAVQALAALNGRNVLVEFLTAPREASDPVERLGDDAVINAAARAITKYRDDDTFRLLLGLAKRRLLPGVVAALGSFRRAEAIPCLVDALAEDESRPVAETALERFGTAAHDALAATVAGTNSPLDRISSSQMRQRQSALGLLVKMAHLAKRRPRPQMR